MIYTLLVTFGYTRFYTFTVEHSRTELLLGWFLPRWLLDLRLVERSVVGWITRWVIYGARYTTTLPTHHTLHCVVYTPHTFTVVPVGVTRFTHTLTVPVYRTLILRFYVGPL